MSARRARTRVRISRRVRPGAVRADRPGERLRCLVLASRPTECLAVDLASAAFVRLCEMPDAEGRAPSASAPDVEGAAFASSRALDVLEVVIGPEPTPADPVRPERVVVDAPPVVLGRPRVRRARHLLDAIAQHERAGVAILGTRGPSIAYVDLDGSAPSLALLRVKPRQLALLPDADGSARLALSWAGARLQLPVADAHASAAAAGRALRANAIS